MFNVVIDAFGGDNAPKEIVNGALLALNDRQDLTITLVGKEKEIKKVLENKNYDNNRLLIVNADEVIGNDETPTIAIRKKTNSSLVKAYDLLKENDDYIGLVSAGSTGAILTGAFLKLGRIKGISRPALCPILPTQKGGVVAIIDVGANVDTKPINLVHFALMGNAYLKELYNIEKPKVALLNIGTEESKGNELTKQTFELLKTMPNINFVGNMEARELLSGEYDLIVCDGFSGNVLLKSTEGAIYNLLKIMKREIKSRFLSKIGYIFMKKTFKAIKKQLDYSEYGGAVFLGCKKLVVKAHGSSEAKSIKTAILQIVEMTQNNLIKSIEDDLKEINLETETK